MGAVPVTSTTVVDAPGFKLTFTVEDEPTSKSVVWETVANPCLVIFTV